MTTTSEPTADFHVPQKPYSVIDCINRVASATGSPMYARSSEHGDYNGHALRLYYNSFRRYYLVEYQWAGRCVITRTSDARAAISDALREFARQGCGATLSVHLREVDAAVAADFPELLPGAESAFAPWRTWKHNLAPTALRLERQTGIGHVNLLLQSDTEAEYDAALTAAYALRRNVA